MLLTAGLVAGWYYLRNWIELGSPFIGGWERRSGLVWWQDPGYRTLSQFFTFGQSLTYPIYSGTRGFIDAFYSTFWLDGWLSALNVLHTLSPWNNEFMLAGSLLGIVPSIGIVLGLIHVVARPCRTIAQGTMFAGSWIMVYVAAMLFLFATIPCYSTVKATYTCGLTPCYALLGAEGLGFLMHGRILRALVYALMACWAVAAYCSYFAIHPVPF